MGRYLDLSGDVASACNATKAYKSISVIFWSLVVLRTPYYRWELVMNLTLRLPYPWG
jgi:hypothetical protein